ncbi:MAG: adenosylmethionine decarboxylase [Candidatus Paceibacterota bacterium]|jgi:S-adenosylmethionine decarboxylase|nr:adenosylmethionine decarboxylase [Candidatus Paceibacterota bacterium]MDD3548565.1 adenosylmethionine decarboxylase [Candidatus Paceibacterota bacterium]MDD4999052.1 adenosylmethionine decarboxylase [Candidatus Paceibacterota bacterium]MDD5545171.1 adenosylmethionine decarboxylase [Candidatus Paceibacterota bacterium]
MKHGEHILIEAIAENQKDLSKTVLIKKLFRKIIKAVKLTAISPIEIYKFPALDKNTLGGLTAFCIVSESHLSIHTWPEDNYFAFDLFSCKDFDEKLVAKLVSETLKTKKMKKIVLKRNI